MSNAWSEQRVAIALLLSAWGFFLAWCCSGSWFKTLMNNVIVWVFGGITVRNGLVVQHRRKISNSSFFFQFFSRNCTSFAQWEDCWDDRPRKWTVLLLVNLLSDVSAICDDLFVTSHPRLKLRVLMGSPVFLMVWTVVCEVFNRSTGLLLVSFLPNAEQPRIHIFRSQSCRDGMLPNTQCQKKRCKTKRQHTQWSKLHDAARHKFTRCKMTGYNTVQS